MCPDCSYGRLYTSSPRKLLSFSGTAAVNVNRYQKEVLRCNACLKEFMNKQRIDKWTNSARSTIALHKVMGLPFNRMFNLQMLYNTPVSEGSMWRQIEMLWNECGRVIYDELYKHASNCYNYYVDDTGVQILEVVAKNKNLTKAERRKCNTTIICTRFQELHDIVLYISDEKHSGENFASLLEFRTAEIANINMMADASSNNFSKLSAENLSKINIFKCLAHGRRKFYELLGFEPEYSLWFLKRIGVIYKNDDHCKSAGYTAEQRLLYHQEHSLPEIDKIYKRIGDLFTKKLVEPNSMLGKAMKYWLNHKDGLTRFLDVPGMLLDNSIAEQGFKNIILQRKNSYFFKTKNSASILSGITSIIMTCKQNNINAYNYLNWLQEHWLHAQKNPEDYLPWKYKEIKESKGDPPAQSVAA